MRGRRKLGPRPEHAANSGDSTVGKPRRPAPATKRAAPAAAAAAGKRPRGAASSAASVAPAAAGALERQLKDLEPCFAPLPTPPPPGWHLDLNPDEPGQTFAEYLADAPDLLGGEYRPQGTGRTTIYLQPVVGASAAASDDFAALVAVLADFCRVFFPGLAVRVNKPWALSAPAKNAVQATPNSKGKTKAKAGSGSSSGCPKQILLTTAAGEYDLRCRRAPDSGRRHLQLNLGDIVDALLWRVPADAWCVIGVTMADLYEAAGDVFCVGRAWGASRAGVFSFLRYAPGFPQAAASIDPISAAALGAPASPPAASPPAAGAAELLASRACKTLVHEIGHCLLIDHCIKCRCLMNGTANLEEDYATPMFLCPEDLRKLQHALGFDLVQRYRGMDAFFATHKGFSEEQIGIRSLLSKLTKP